MASAPTSKGPALPVTRPPAMTGTACPSLRPIRRLKNMIGTSRPARWPDLAAEIEDPLALEKEVALLGEEQAEAREVDLLLVLLDLREVGVDRQVGGQPAREAVLHIDADVAADVVAERHARRAVGRQRRTRRTA